RRAMVLAERWSGVVLAARTGDRPRDRRRISTPARTYEPAARPRARRRGAPHRPDRATRNLVGALRLVRLGSPLGPSALTGVPGGGVRRRDRGRHADRGEISQQSRAVPRGVGRLP